MSAASKTTQAVVSPGETAFLIEFSVALHKHAMYPTGHQSLEPAAARVAERAARLLLENRPTLAFGVARHQLIIEGIATDPNHPVLRRLAETLHQHHLGAVSILRGVEAHEISGALLALAEEVSNGTALGLTPGGRLPEWPHVRLHPLTLADSSWSRKATAAARRLDLAAVVAYENHLMLDGGGYPARHYAHTTTFASQLVHICDVFDALRTKRPYRDAWDIEKVYAYLLERAGVEFDSILVARFIEMMRRTKMQLGAVAEDVPAGL